MIANSKINYLDALKSVAFKITYLCNLSCVMCGQGRFYRENMCNVNANHLELDVLKGVIDEVQKYTPQIYIWGGEPLLYPHLADFLHYIKIKGLNSFVTTNGILLDAFVEQLVEQRVAEITVSLDGPMEVHEKIRGKTGIYNKIVNNLRLLNEHKQKVGKVLPIVDLHIVVVRENYSMLYDFVSMLKRENLCRRIRIQLPMFFTIDMSNEFKGYVKDTFDKADGKSWAYFTDDYADMDLEVLNENIRRIKEEYKNILYFPSNVDIDTWFKKPEHPFREKCLTAFKRINIEPNGDVIACPNFPETVYGNILKESLETIFNNEIISKHRNAICQNPSMICPRCSYLYLY